MVERRIPICILPQEIHFSDFQSLLNAFKYFEGKRNTVIFQDGLQKDKFEKVKQIDTAEYLLLPYNSNYDVLYRGQNSYYEKCLPTIYRGNPTEVQILADLTRIEEFRILLDKLPITHFFRKNFFHVDYEGLAQHYGLRTRVLDFTSDPEIAFFFAMCDYRNGKYYPKNENKEYIGYIYAFYVLTYVQDGSDSYVFNDKVKPIGLQPFKRPGLQKGFSYLSDKKGFQFGYLYSFSFTKRDSIEIYNRFDRGNSLWVDDGVKKYADKILNSNSFSNQAIINAIRNYNLRKGVKFYRNLLLKNDYKIESSKKLEWTSYRCGFSKVDRKNFLEKVTQRSYIRDGELMNECLDTKVLGSNLYASLLSDYNFNKALCDTGIYKIPINGNYVTEITNYHKYTKPSNDGKIHCANWVKSLV